MVIAAGGIDLCTVLDVGSVGSDIGGAPSPNSWSMRQEKPTPTARGVLPSLLIHSSLSADWLYWYTP